MNVHAVHAYLVSSYWAEGIPLETVAKFIDGSLCFGVFDGASQVGFARVITDKAQIQRAPSQWDANCPTCHT